MSRGYWRWGGLALTIGLVAVWFGVGGSGKPSRSATSPEPLERATTPAAPAVTRVAPTPLVERAERPVPEDRIAIESVEVDKSEVCRGEDVTVKIKAASLQGEDADLTYGVVDKPRLFGPTFTFRVDESVGIDQMMVFVRGRRGTHELRAIPPILVKECETPQRLRIESRRNPDRPDQAKLEVAIESVPGSQPFAPESFDWDFGDGARSSTREPTVTHSYEGRLQTVSHSYFFVSVTARDAAGKTAKGGLTVRFVNFGYADWRDTKRVTVFASFERAEGDGERTTLYHGAPVPITLDTVTVSELGLDADQQELHLNRRTFSASALLGVSSLPVGAVLTTSDLGHLRPREPGSRRLLEIEGHGPGTVKVGGAFVLNGPPAETATAAMTSPTVDNDLTREDTDDNQQ